MKNSITYILEPEYIACILLTIIAIYSLSDRKRDSLRQGSFWVALGVSYVTIVVNIISVWEIENPNLVSRGMGMLINSVYFVGMFLMIFAVTFATVVLFYGEGYERTGLRRAAVCMAGCTALMLLLVIANLFTGWLFFYDEAGYYTRGTLNKIAFVDLVLHILITCASFLSERKHIRRSFRRITWMLPLLAGALGVLQYRLPDTILTGTIAACVLLVLFIFGQQQRARIDPLTDLYNRETLYHTLERNARRGQLFYVVYIAIREYKLVNNRYGQQVGDGFLQRIGDYLLSLDHRATAYRFSGVEFAVVVSGMAHNEYEELFRSLCARFKQPFEYDELSLTLTALFVDIAYPAHAADVNELIGAMEYAARLAKDDPSGRSVRYDNRMCSEYGRREYVGGLLEPALKNDRFFLYFQPIYDCKKKRMTSGEVLLRLNEENGRPVSPGEFIPLAMETGIISDLNKMVLDKTCRFLSEHRGENIGWLSVNVSAQQHELEGTIELVRDLLQKYDIPPSQLKLEITERVLLDDLDSAKATMEKLRALGIGVFLDDFGTGYSNLVNVMSLPFECVKIDKGFVHHIEQSERAFGMMETVVRGLRALGVTILAEGVETAEQNIAVHELGVDTIQGYFYARPMPDDVLAWTMRDGRVQ